MESLTYKRNKVEIPKYNFFFRHLCKEKKKKKDRNVCVRKWSTWTASDLAILYSTYRTNLSIVETNISPNFFLSFYKK